MQGPIRSEFAGLNPQTQDELVVWVHVHDFNNDPFARFTKIRRRVVARAFQIGASIELLAPSHQVLGRRGADVAA